MTALPARGSDILGPEQVHDGAMGISRASLHQCDGDGLGGPLGSDPHLVVAFGQQEGWPHGPQLTATISRPIPSTRESSSGGWNTMNSLRLGISSLTQNSSPSVIRERSSSASLAADSGSGLGRRMSAYG
ncbi:hypothetical protein OHR68_33105 [Spirillospora sp. NBC_00431]